MEETPDNSEVIAEKTQEINNMQEFEPEVVTKKKRTLTPAELANLEKMRHKNAVKSEAKKLIQSEVGCAPQTFVGANGPNDILQVRQKYEQDLEEVREIKNYLKEYFEYKQHKNDLKKQTNNSPINQVKSKGSSAGRINNNDWEYQDEYTNQVQFKFKI